MPNVGEKVLSEVQRDLVALRSFVESCVLFSSFRFFICGTDERHTRSEQHLFTHLPDSSSRGSTPNSAFAAEQSSLSSLRLLLTQSVEAISFVLLLIDYKLADIVAASSSEVQEKLVGLSYAELLTTKKGRDVARGLVSAVINQQIGRHLSVRCSASYLSLIGNSRVSSSQVDAISETLQQRCGSFCSTDDVLLYKAIESMRRARDTYDSGERTESLRESLRLVVIAPSVCSRTSRLTLIH